MKKAIFLHIWLIHAIQAQTTWTMEQCVYYAFANKETIKNQKLDQQITNERLGQSLSQLYPQLKGSADVRDNVLLPTTLLPGTLIGLPASEKIPVQFGLQYNATAALDANWVLYNPSFFAEIKSLKQSMMINSANNELQKRNLRFDVALAYYGSLLAQERIRLQSALLNKYRRALEEAQSLFKNQQISLVELHKAEWNMKNQEAEVERASQSMEKSLYNLKYQMAYPADSSIVLSDPLSVDLSDSQEINEVVDYKSRPEYKVLSMQLQQEGLNKKKYQLSYLPSLSAYGYLGKQSFRTQFDFLSSSALWYNVSYIGLKLSLPVFDGFQKKHQIQESKIQESKKTNEIKAFEKQYRYEVENGKRNVVNALKMVQIRNNNLTFAQEQRNKSEFRYKEGLSDIKDLTDANSMVAEAQNLYLTSLHDYLVAKLEYEKVK